MNLNSYTAGGEMKHTATDFNQLPIHQNHRTVIEEPSGINKFNQVLETPQQKFD